METIVLYDEDCGFCRWSADRVLALDRRHRLRAVAIQSSEGVELLAPIAPERRLASWHVRTPDARIVSGGAGVPILLEQLPGGWPLARLAERFPNATGRLYGLVSRNRTRLGRLIGVRACSVDPSRRYAGTIRNTGPASDRT